MTLPLFIGNEENMSESRTELETLRMERTRHIMAQSDFAKWQNVSHFILSTADLATDLKRICDFSTYNASPTKEQTEAAAYILSVIEKQCKAVLGTTLIQPE